MTPLQVRIITALRRHAGKRNTVNIAFELLAADIGEGVSIQEVHVALQDLMSDGFFLDQPRCDGGVFGGRLPS